MGGLMDIHDEYSAFISVVKQPSHHCFGVVVDSNQKVWVAIKGEI